MEFSIYPSHRSLGKEGVMTHENTSTDLLTEHFQARPDYKKSHSVHSILVLYFVITVFYHFFIQLLYFKTSFLASYFCLIVLNFLKEDLLLTGSRNLT